MDITTIVVICAFSAVIGGIITNTKNRGYTDGVALGALLGVIGVIIAACLSKKASPGPPGTQSVTCPRCNAVQNVNVTDAQYECWQCHLTTGLYRTSTTRRSERKVRCHNCSTVAEVGAAGTSFPCPSCNATMHIPG